MPQQQVSQSSPEGVRTILRCCVELIHRGQGSSHRSETLIHFFPHSTLAFARWKTMVVGCIGFASSSCLGQSGIEQVLFQMIRYPSLSIYDD